MTDVKQLYVDLIRKRSQENEKAIALLFDANLFGMCMATLRQELDSFIRVLYLGRISDFNERERLMSQTLAGEKWTVLTPNGKLKQITDRDLVDKSTELKSYVQYVYKFGCSFIHLSDFHNYATINPFDKLDYTEQFDIKLYLNQYHGFPRSGELTVNNISNIVPAIFKKVSENMSYYLSVILNNGMIET